MLKNTVKPQLSGFKWKNQAILWNLENLTHKYTEHCIYIVHFSYYEIK